MKEIIKKFNLNYTVTKGVEIIKGSINMFSTHKIWAINKLRWTLRQTHGDDSDIKIDE